MTERAVIYARISQDRIGAGLGVEEQERLCRELAAQRGYGVVGVYTDNDLSAYSGKPRPGYLRMLEAIKAGKIDRVLAWHTDRVHRSNLELEEYITAVDAYDIQTETVKAGPLDLSSPTGRMIARQLCTIARYESEHRAERVSAARLRQARAGKYGGGRRPYGFEPDGITVRSAEAAEILDMAQKFLAGVPLRAIAKDLRDRQVPSTYGNFWDSSRVRAILIRPRNAGFMVHKQGDPRIGGKSRTWAYTDDDIVGKAPWEPIIPEEMWRAVVAKLRDPNRVTTTGPAPVWLGTGIYRCHCGSAMRGTRANRGQRYDKYVCKVTGKGHTTIRAQDIDDLVKDTLFARLSQPDAAELLTSPGSGPDLETLRQELAVHRARLEELAADYDADLITRGQFLTGTESRRKKIAEVEAQLSTHTELSPLAPLIQATDLHQAWKAMGLGGQRAAVRAFMTITVQPVGAGRRRVPVEERVIIGRATA